MTDHGSYVSVEAEEMDLRELIKRVRQDSRPVRILDHGQPVAELTPARKRWQLNSVDPRLKVEFAPDYDPCGGISEEDWPAHLR
jgi:prevent-host-death family protein